MLTPSKIEEFAGRKTGMNRSATLKSVPSWITSSNTMIGLTSSQPIVQATGTQNS